MSLSLNRVNMDQPLCPPAHPTTTSSTSQRWLYDYDHGCVRLSTNGVGQVESKVKEKYEKQSMTSQPVQGGVPYRTDEQQYLQILKKTGVQNVCRAYRGRLEREMDAYTHRNSAVSTEVQVA
ncbi:hypothetical protein TNCV_1799901 [Trichonephila clavipes]|nr:hypothetical protein TNCV_1799901 [Trichonephila clavipes]